MESAGTVDFFTNIDIDIRPGEEKNEAVGGMYSFVERVSHKPLLPLGSCLDFDG